MVVSKRCKICTIIDPNNVSFLGEYFNKSIPDLMKNLSGIELDAHKIRDALICPPCIIQLMNAEAVIEKLQNVVHRFKKIEKDAKLKTPLRIQSTPIAKTKNGVEEKKEQTNDSDAQTCVDEVKAEVKLKTPKKIVRRKSVFPKDDQNAKNDQNETASKGVSKNSAKIIDDSVTSINGTITKELLTSEEQIDNLSLSIAQNLSAKVTENESFTNNNDKQLNQTTIGDPQVSIDEAKGQAGKANTPKKAVKRKSVASAEKPKAEATNNGAVTKFKKFTDKAVTASTNDEKVTKFQIILGNSVRPTKNIDEKVSKRKLKSLREDADGDVSLSDSQANTATKRCKSISMSGNEETPVDLTTEEQDRKYTSCIICEDIFWSKGALKNHIKSDHPGEKLKSCPHCLCEFRSKQKYESHICGEKCKTNNYPCQYPNCEKRFKTVEKMELHMQKKHSSHNEIGSEQDF